MIFSRSLPYSTRAAYHHESRYSVLKGASWGVSLLAAVVVEKTLGGTAWHLSALAAAVPASMLLAPMLAQLGRRVGMKAVVVGAAIACSVFMVAQAAPLPVTWFTAVACAMFLTSGPTIVAETTLYKANYPDTHRGWTVGLLRMFAFAAAGLVGLGAGQCLDLWPTSYHIIFPVGGVLALLASVYYARIRVRGREFQGGSGGSRGSRLGLAEAVAVVRKDRRFVIYEIGYILAGSANFIGFPFIVKSLNEDLHARALAIVVVLALIPNLLQAVTSPFWGRWLDRVSPMTARVIFGILLMGSYGSFLAGSLWGVYSLFCVGAVLRGLLLGGSMVVWATGSLYFAGTRDAAPAYTSVHVSLTGLRGSIMPFVGAVLYERIGAWTFGVSVVLAGASTLLFVAYVVLERLGAVGHTVAADAAPAPTRRPCE